MIAPSTACIKLIEGFETYRNIAYKDIRGIWTVGYGATGPLITENSAMSLPEASEWLLVRCNQLANQLSNLVHVPLTQNQADALISLCYNIGITAFAGSTLLKQLNLKNFVYAGNEILKWDHAGGLIIEGLRRRRDAEYTLFMSKT